jgi:transcriptional regulator with XRE-family HTH domain
MTSPSALDEMSPQDRALYGYSKARNAAFQAVQKLWRRRKADGMTQLQLGQRIGMDPARVSKYLSGPGNWTLRTFGELVEALDGEAEIIVYGMEVPPTKLTNYHAYVGYERPALPDPTSTTAQAILSLTPWHVSTKPAAR